MKTYNYLSMITVLVLGSSACSMKDRTEVHSVSVQLPKVWANSSSLNVLNHASSSMSVSYSAPTSLASFQCYGLNVTGPGIQADTRMQCSNPNSGMGMIAGFVPVSSGRIEMMVPAGGNRKVTLIGIQSSIGCPILDELLRNGGPNALEDLGEPYILGSTTTDIFDDTAVTILASFDQDSRAFEGCGDHDGGGSGTLKLQVTANEPKIQGNNGCNRTGIYAQYGNDISVLNGIQVMPTVTSGTAAYFNDAGCSIPATYKSFSGNYANFWVQTSASAGTFTAEISSTGASGWTTSSVTYTIVPERLEAGNMTPGTTPTNTCTGFPIQHYTASIPPSPSPTPMYNGSLGTIEVEVMSEDNNSLPSLDLFGSADNTCATPLVPSSTTANSKIYTFSSIASASQYLYAKDIDPENVYIAVRSVSSLAQPAGTRMGFVPFTATPIYSPFPSVPTGGGTFALGFTGTNQANYITDIKVGGVSCGTFTASAVSSISCISIPPFPDGSQKPVSVIHNGTEYLIGVNVMYGYPPSIGTNNILAYVGISLSYNLVVSAAPGYWCSYQSLGGTGLSINSNCSITGIPASSGTYPGSFSIVVNDALGSVTNLITNLTIEGPPSFVNVSDPYQSPCSAGGSNCTTIGTSNYGLSGGLVNLIPPMINTTGMNCLITGLPPGLTYNSSTCAITGTPTSPSSTNYSVSIMVSKAPFANYTGGITINW